MLFNSFDFGIFLAVGFGIYHLLQRWRWPWLLWLLLISAFFYGCWKPWYLILIAISTVNSFTFGLLIERSKTVGLRKLLLALTVGFDLTLLGVFKYGNFFLDNVEAAAAMVGYPVQLGAVPAELPVGISFYTFQTLSYTIDVYRKKLKPTANLLEFSVFVFFFPQLVAGPIVRASELLPQVIGTRPRMDTKAIGQGIFLILSGLAKKMILADTLYTTMVLPFFEKPDGHNALETILVLWSANFQVYCDFSGYSDVAIGAALLFGFKLPDNFNRPFWSRTPMEHWRRWHISLSTWLRDYLYIPLGGSRKGPIRTQINLIITFLLGGLWHGAGWTFLVWGLYNGILLAFWRKIVRHKATSLPGKALEMFVTFNAICLGLVFLHAHSFYDSWLILTSLLAPTRAWSGVLDPIGLLTLVAAFALHATPQRWKSQLSDAFSTTSPWGLALIILMAGGVLSLFAGLASPFFYFQF
ncbi:MAG: alginate O-acetyltransferase complex protein AlgI [Myxococcota bacterium]|jgi:alginate O-acetyltransferase complex protein AlgI